MPHIVLEYSSNLGDRRSAVALLEKLHRSVADTESFETDRIKSRAIELETYRIGTDEARGFVHATVVFSPGRQDALRQDLGGRLLQILINGTGSTEIEPSRSVEIRQFERAMYFTDRKTE